MFLTVICLSAQLSAQVITYEGNGPPEREGWTRLVGGTPGADRSNVDGWLVLSVDLPDGWAGPDGDAESYRLELSDFAGVTTFFVEWRAVTDNPAWLLDLSQTPAVVSAAGRGAAIYHTTMTNSKVQLFRDTFIPLVDVPIRPTVPHVYRVEAYGTDSYIWYIDGEVVDSGAPEGPYPYGSAFIIWGARRSYVDATTAWDYVRFGVIPQDASGDYDSDGALTLFDYYFARDCLTKDGPGILSGPGENAGPGCRFTDFDSDGDVDLLDFADFQNAFSEPHP